MKYTIKLISLVNKIRSRYIDTTHLVAESGFNYEKQNIYYNSIKRDETNHMRWTKRYIIKH